MTIPRVRHLTRYILLLIFLTVTPFLLANVIFENGFEGDPMVIPPDPESVAPPNPDYGITDIFASTEFLYSGDNPIQTGVSPGTINETRVAIIRGRVTNQAGSPLSGAIVTVLGHPELGQTLSRLDGRYDLAVNGGGKITLNYARLDYLTAQRRVETLWREWANAVDVALISLDPVVTPIDLSSSEEFQVARGSMQNDGDGDRQATLLFPQGTTAELVFPNGSKQPLSQLNVRATEYTVGPNGPQAMPAELPPTSGYTYAVELSADEAFNTGASDVKFSQPLWFYVENFIGFPTGGVVPSGYYDRIKGVWVPSDNGRVIDILSVNGGAATVDVDGDGVSDTGSTLTELGFTDAELEQLAQLYAGGTSLWRVPIEHFTPWDHNWPYGPPDDAEAPPDPLKNNDFPDRDDPCKAAGSIIECQTQTLRESIALAGTPFSLNYRSDRVRAGQIIEQVVISGNTVPESLKRIEVELNVAGQVITSVLPAEPDQIANLEWDGTDAYGRIVQGGTSATIKVTYWYAAVYYAPGDFAQSFGRLPSGTDGVAGRGAGEVGISRSYVMGSNSLRALGVLDARTQGLGGWTIEPQHVYDAARKSLYLGSGARQEDDSGFGNYTINFVEAVEEKISFNQIYEVYPFDNFRTSSIDITGDGTIYVGGKQSTNQISKIIRVLANGSAETLSTMSGSASAYDVAPHPDGAVYYIDNFFGAADIPTILRLFDPDISDTQDEENTILLTGLNDVDDLEVDSEGGIYFSSGDDNKVFYIPPDKVGPNQITMDDVLVVAGTGTGGFSGDDGLATVARLNSPRGLEIGPDGSLYIADLLNARVRRIAPDGIITTIAGNGVLGNDGDGLSALQAKLRPLWLALDANGGLFITTTFGLRYVSPDGIITSLAGKDSVKDIVDVREGYPLSRIKQASSGTFHQVAIGPDREPYMTIQGGFSNREGRLVRLASVLPGFVPGGNSIASSDATQLYAFDQQGRHLQTIDTFTGEVIFDFSYGAFGSLTAITNEDGDVTTIQRDSEGRATGIMSPDGQLTQLSVNDDLLLTALSNPEDESFVMSYHAQTNKLISLENPLQQTSTFEYNNKGRLIKDTDSLSGFTSLIRSSTNDSTTVTRESALGEVFTYEATFHPDDSIVLHNTTPAGAITEIERRPDGTEIIRHPTGTEITNVLDPDPRFGSTASLLTSTMITPGGKSIIYSKTRSATLIDGELLNLESLVETTKYGSRNYTRTFDKAARTIVTNTPSGLQQTSTYNSQWRLAELQSPGLAPRLFTYNGERQITRIEQNAQYLEFEYDAHDRIDLVRDPGGRTMKYTYDNADRLTQVILPSDRTYVLGYDDNGNNTSLQMPNAAIHTLGYSQVDMLESYSNPTDDEYNWTYDLDRKRSQLELPSLRAINYNYDAGGRIDLVTYPEATVNYVHVDTTLLMGSTTWTPTSGPAQTVSYGYDGHLTLSMAFTGVTNGVFSYIYDSDVKLTGIQLDALPAITSSFNNDGLLTAHGPFQIARNETTSLPEQVSDGTMTIDYTFDGNGRVLTRTHKLDGVEMYLLQLDYDISGRLQGRTETVMGASQEFTYNYDQDEQLISVAIDLVPEEVYDYDDNGNRTIANAVTATYDAADSITSVGGTSYTIDDDGFMVARGTDSFSYSARGELLTATVGGKQVNYTYDGMARLVARTDAGGTTQYLYGNPAVPFMVTHSRTPDDVLTSYYYNEAGLLMALERNDILYYVAVDQVGSSRVIYDAFGIIKTMSYSSFGVLQSDSNPGFDLAIGFAGGITDPDTGLVRFGLRDYDPLSSRWLARDPVMFTGGPNLFMYSGNNPVLKRDPSGLACVGAEAYAGIGGGIELCYKDGQWSYCSEVGFGAGSSLKLQPLGDVAGPADNLFLKAELVAKLGPFELGGELKSNDCGTSVKEKCGTFLLECSGKVKADVNDLRSDKKVSDAFGDYLGNRTADDGSWKAGLSAKVKAGACLGSKLL